MRIAILLLLALVAAAQAQQADDDGRKRMVFPAGSTEPMPTATPAGASPGNPTEVLDAFFTALKSNRTDFAYDALVKGTVIGQRQEDVKSLKERTQQALDNYGPVSGYETIDDRTVGTCLLRRTCISLNSDLPLRWRFYFYKINGAWRLVDLRVDDGLVELFNEVTQKK